MGNDGWSDAEWDSQIDVIIRTARADGIKLKRARPRKRKKPTGVRAPKPEMRGLIVCDECGLLAPPRNARPWQRFCSRKCQVKQFHRLVQRNVEYRARDNERRRRRHKEVANEVVD